MLNRVLLLFIVVLSGCIEEKESDLDPAYPSDASAPMDQFISLDSAFSDLGNIQAQDISPIVVDAAVSSDMEQVFASDVSTSPDVMVELDAEFAGTTANSCGNLLEGRMRVDCTLNGDDDATCVFGDHCFCSPEFRCTSEVLYAGTNECDPGASCVPRMDEDRCGSPQLPFLRVDCGQLGDTGASCVGGLNCRCSEGYRAVRTIPKSQVNYANQTKRVPENQGGEGTRRTAAVLIAAILVRLLWYFGDSGAFCVFGDHCLSDGFVCERVVYPGVRRLAVYGVQRNRLKKS